jgi:glycosyltransferase involved in cell wall biosynthesis
LINILFQTKNLKGPSTIFNKSLLEGLNELKDISIDFYNTNYNNYNVVLFMGYDPDTKKAKQNNPSIKVGIIDPRPSFDIDFTDVDFILANGIEMRDYYSKFSKNIFNYYIYPKVKPLNIKRDDQKIVVGYHGNKIHLMASKERVMPAIELLSRNYKVELWLMYDIKTLGKWEYNSLSKNLLIKHIQWDEDGYQKYMSQADIGVVPSLTPMKSSSLLRKIFKNFFNKFNKNSSDYIFRFKVTSNVGRGLVFAQLKVPVIMDMTPSALQFVSDSNSGFLCHSTESWFNSLSKLAENKRLRFDMAENLYKEFNLNYSPKCINVKFKNFLTDSIITND